MTKPKKPSLLQQAQATPAYHRNWISALSPDQQADVMELLKAKKAGTITMGRDSIVKLLKANGITTSETAVRRVLNRMGAE